MANISQNAQIFDAENAKYNPEFAGLAASTLRQAAPIEGFSDFIKNLAQEQRGYKHDIDMEKLRQKREDDLYRRNLISQYQLGLGGLEDVSKMDNNRLRQAIYARQLSMNPQQNVPNLRGIGNIVEQSGIDIPNFAQGNRVSEMDIPTFNAKGRLSLEDLPNLGKTYPYLSRTAQGRDILNRIENTIAQNPDNLAALKPYLAELQQGNIPLVPESRPLNRTPFKGATTLDEKLMKDMDTGSYVAGYPFWKLGQFVNSFGKDYPNEAEQNAMKYGYVPERVKDRSGELFGSLKTWLQNRERSNKAEDYVSKIKPIYDDMMRMDIRPINVSPKDQPTQQLRRQLALELNLNSPYDVQVGIDAFGRNVLYANGGVYLAGNNGTFIKIK